METDIWGQLALEASQVYLTDGVKRSPFADTVQKLRTLRLDGGPFAIGRASRLFLAARYYEIIQTRAYIVEPLFSCFDF